MRWIRCSAALLVLAALAACSPAGPDLSEAAERGKATYFTVCIACHNAKPSLDGLGPAIAGSSRDVLEARVIHGVYPPGYQPKRKSQAMPAFPHLAGNIDDLAAYLAECCPAK
jgi:mono/diheme cytochrome c family protein